MTGKIANPRRVLRLLLIVLAGVFLIAQIQPKVAPVAPAAPASPAGKLKSPGPVYIISLHGMVNDVMRDRLKRQTEQAVRSGASTIVLKMNTWGGLVTSALEMCDQIKGLKVPTLAWVKPKAISAGAMISLACDQIVVADPARIGDCMPISGSGVPLGDAEREKVETVIREEFRDSGVRHGYPLALCIAMVTRGPAVYQIEHRTDHVKRYVFSTELFAYGLTVNHASVAPQGEHPSKPAPAASGTSGRQMNLQDAIRRMIAPAPGQPEPKNPSDPPSATPSVAASDSAASDPTPLQTPYDPGHWRIVRQVLAAKHLLTMSQDKAIEFGFAKKIINNETDLAQYLDVPVSSIISLRANWSEKLVDFLTSAFVRGILTILLLMAIYSEMQAPGLGFAAAVAIVAGALLLGAPYLAGLASMWELLLILLGIILLGIEIFITPGFGILGITGLILMFLGLLLTFVPIEPGPGIIPQLPGTWDAMQKGLLTILSSFAIALVGIFFLTKYFGSIPLLNRLILTGSITEPPAAGPEVTGNALDGEGETLGIKAGDAGQALNDLRPAGRAQFGPLIVDVVTDGAWIEADSAVVILAIKGNRVVVRKK